jgi:beta-N-acetylhexosaminidase
MDEMVAVARAVPEMSDEGQSRLRRAMETIAAGEEGPGLEELIAKRDELLALA